MSPRRNNRTVQRPLIYFDNASTSWPKPPAVAEAMARRLRDGLASPARGGHALARDAESLLRQVRLRLAQRIGANAPERIVLTSGATHAINTAILGLLLFGSAGVTRPRVVTTVLEHNAVLRPLRWLESKGRIELILVGCGGRGVVDPGDVLAAAGPTTAMVAMTAASNVTGAIQPVEAVAQALRDRAPDALLLVDASQSVGLLPSDVERRGIDLLAFSGHKALLGPTGTGALYISERVPLGLSADGPFLHPVVFGGTGGDAEAPGMPPALPARFEAGTPNTLGFAGLLAAMDEAPRPPAETLQHERAMMQTLRERLSAFRGITLLGPDDPEASVGVLAITFDACDPADAAAILDGQFNIAVRAGLHCAPLTHEALGTLQRGGALRVSTGPYTTIEDIDHFVAAAADIASL